MYVGKTVRSLAQRLSCHVAKAKGLPRVTPVQKWIYGLLSVKLLPVITLIKKTEVYSDESEAEIIERYREKNPELLNVLSGNRSFYRKSAELFQKARRSRNWSVTETAYHLKSCAAMVYDIEGGRRIPNGRKLANRIQKLLGIPTTAWDEPEAPTGGEAAK
jgi:ribosome-binding protein aMBF1 (putative translation factor)